MRERGVMHQRPRFERLLHMMLKVVTIALIVALAIDAQSGEPLREVCGTFAYVAVVADAVLLLLLISLRDEDSR